MTMRTRPKKPVCAKCGSGEVGCNAPATWDRDRQAWTVSADPATDDRYWCDSDQCDGDDTRIVWADVDAEQPDPWALDVMERLTADQREALAGVLAAIVPRDKDADIPESSRAAVRDARGLIDAWDRCGGCRQHTCVCQRAEGGAA